MMAEQEAGDNGAHTGAADLAALATRYEIDRLALVDLFPQTFHLETIASLRLR